VLEASPRPADECVTARGWRAASHRSGMTATSKSAGFIRGRRKLRPRVFERSAIPPGSSQISGSTPSSAGLGSGSGSGLKPKSRASYRVPAMSRSCLERVPAAPAMASQSGAVAWLHSARPEHQPRSQPLPSRANKENSPLNLLTALHSAPERPGSVGEHEGRNQAVCHAVGDDGIGQLTAAMIRQSISHARQCAGQPATVQRAEEKR
jgi:hypothetical protein